MDRITGLSDHPGTFRSDPKGAMPSPKTCSPTGLHWIYLTFIGGSGGEDGRGIAIDSSGSAYICGLTDSGDFQQHLPRSYPHTGETVMGLLRSSLPTAGALSYATSIGAMDSISRRR